MVKNLANARAKFAFEKVNSIKKDDKLKKYRSLVRSFPAMILSNGYGMAIAYIYSKRDQDEFGLLYYHIEKWLKDNELIKGDNQIKGNNKNDPLINTLASGNDTYRLLENETLALLEWLKRFAEGASLDGK